MFKEEFKNVLNFNKHIDESVAVVEHVKFPGVKENVDVFMKRIDLVHPVISGNKWYKMKYNIVEMKKRGLKTLLTFGGAYSNHIHAAAKSGQIFGFDTIGLIRGEEHLPLNGTLKAALDCGMKLHYVDRTTFRERESEVFLNLIKKKFGNVYILPVGGSNTIAVKGCAEIVDQIDIDYNYLCTASGSGATFAGLLAGLKGSRKAIGFPALRGGEFLESVISELIFDYSGNRYTNWKLNTDYHFGGFAKLSKELIEFTYEFEQINGFPLDYIYTNKMMFGIGDLIKQGYFKAGERIVAIHSGGIQGNDGMKEKIDRILNNNDETSPYLKHLN